MCGLAQTRVETILARFSARIGRNCRAPPSRGDPRPRIFPTCQTSLDRAQPSAISRLYLCGGGSKPVYCPLEVFRSASFKVLVSLSAQIDRRAASSFLHLIGMRRAESFQLLLCESNSGGVGRRETECERLPWATAMHGVMTAKPIRGAHGGLHHLRLTNLPSRSSGIHYAELTGAV